jgi:pilus assembly protein CpaC
MTTATAGLATLLAISPLAAARAQPPAPSADTPSREVIISAGKAQVLDLPQAYTDVMIADPKIADVLPLNNHSVYVVGKAVGSTALTIYGPGRQLIAAANVVVSADIDGLKARLAELLPTERDIVVRPANKSIVLSGVVSSPAAMQQAVALAQSYLPPSSQQGADQAGPLGALVSGMLAAQQGAQERASVINMLGVEGTQQIMLSVRFVEMERSVAKNLRVNVNRTPTNGNPSVSLFTGDTLVKNAGRLVDSFGSVSLLFNNNLEFLLDALETKGAIRTLAEPNLMANSGDTANFLAGGEFPIPVAQTNNGNTPTITIEYKQFGVGLAFTPTLLRDGLMNIVVNPEVSSIDPSISVNIGLIQVPGIKVRRAHTTVELRDGESFTIAGLLKDEYRGDIRQYPFVGDIPILGSLFRSNGYQRDQTELVIVVTPHLVTARRGMAATPADRFTPPSDFERFLFGWQEGVGRKLKPEDRALISADPNKGGVDGPHGHVLY